MEAGHFYEKQKASLRTQLFENPRVHCFFSGSNTCRKTQPINPFHAHCKNSKPDFITGDIKLFVDGKSVANLTGIKSAFNYSAMTGFGLLVGRNIGTPVSQEYKVPFNFTGKIEKVEIELK